MRRTDAITRPSTIEDLLPSSLAARVAGLDFSSRKIFAGKLKGERRSKKRGQSVEFADHRPYVRGDDVRHIDWSIFARLDRLFLKMYLEEEDLSLHVAIDASGSHDCGEPNKFVFMQRLAMTLSYIGLVNYNRVTMSVIGGVRGGAAAIPSPGLAPPGSATNSPKGRGSEVGIVSSLRDLRGRRRTRDVASFLCGIEPGGTAPFTEACKRIALSRRGKGVMVVLSDLFIKEGFESGLRLLLGRGYDLFVIQCLSPQELEPDRPDGVAGDLRLRDIEDSDVAEVTISAPLLKRYKQNLAAYQESIRVFCARRDIAFMTVRTDMSVETLVLEHLRKRGLVG